MALSVYRSLIIFHVLFATGSTVMVVGTMTVSHKESLTEPVNLGFPTLFTWHYYTPLMNSSDIYSFLAKSNINR